MKLFFFIFICFLQLNFEFSEKCPLEKPIKHPIDKSCSNYNEICDNHDKEICIEFLNACKQCPISNFNLSSLDEFIQNDKIKHNFMEIMIKNLTAIANYIRDDINDNQLLKNDQLTEIKGRLHYLEKMLRNLTAEQDYLESMIKNLTEVTKSKEGINIYNSITWIADKAPIFIIIVIFLGWLGNRYKLFSIFHQRLFKSNSNPSDKQGNDSETSQLNPVS